MPDAIALEWGDEKVTYSALWQVIRALWSVWRDQRRPASAFVIETQLDLDSCLYVIAALAERRRILLVDPALSADHRKAMIERLDLPDVRVVSQAQAALETAQARKPPPSTEAAPMPSADPETGGYYVFTSGSTGSPKGIRGRLIGLEHFCGWQADTFSIGRGDRVAQITNPMFDVVYRELLTPLIAGATLVLPEGARPHADRIISWFEEKAISVVHSVPSLARRWDAATFDSSCKAMKQIFMAGEPLTGSVCNVLQRLFPHAAIVNLYGPSETTLAKFSHPIRNPQHPTQPVGNAMPGTQAFVFDHALRRISSQGCGELVIRTPFRSAGYLDAEATRKSFIENPCRSDVNDTLYLTGDEAEIGTDGLVWLRGRIDDQIKVNGVRITLSEISGVVQAATGQNAIVLAQKHEDETVLKAFIESRHSDRLQRDLDTAFRQHLADFVRPHAVSWIEKFPLTNSGKVDRQALLAHKPRRRPINTAEICRIWSDAFERAIGADDDFFESGGDSLIAAIIAARLHHEVGALISFSDLTAAPTPVLLARRLADRHALADTRSQRAAPEHKPRSQQQSLFATALRHGNGDYATMALAIEMPKTMTAESIRAGLQEIVARHVAFRQQFSIRNDLLALSLADEAALPIESRVFDGPAAEVTAKWVQLSDFLRTPIPVNKAPLAKALVVDAADHSILILAVHHLIADGESMRTLASELRCMCEGEASLPNSPADPPMDMPPTAEDVAFWEREYRSMPFNPRRLYPAPVIGLRRQTAAVINLGETCLVTIRSLGRKLRTTPGTVVLSLLAGFLAARSQDFVINVQSIGFEHAIAPEAIGCFYRPLPLRFVNYPSALTTAAIVDTASQLRQADMAKNVSFARIAEIARCPEPVESGLLPLATTTFNMRRGIKQSFRLWAQDDGLLIAPISTLYEIQLSIDADDPALCALIVGGDLQPETRKIAENFSTYVSTSLLALENEELH